MLAVTSSVITGHCGNRPGQGTAVELVLQIEENSDAVEFVMTGQSRTIYNPTLQRISANQIVGLTKVDGKYFIATIGGAVDGLRFSNREAAR